VSFVCQSCNIAQTPGTKLTKVVTQVRDVQYPAVKDDYGNMRIPVGFEIVKELNFCPECKNTKEFNKVSVGSKVLGKEILEF